jgi:hypothetical protein
MVEYGVTIFRYVRTVLDQIGKKYTVKCN